MLSYKMVISYNKIKYNIFEILAIQEILGNIKKITNFVADISNSFMWPIVTDGVSESVSVALVREKLSF